MPVFLQKLLSCLAIGTVALLQANKNTDKISGKLEETDLMRDLSPNSGLRPGQAS